MEGAGGFQHDEAEHGEQVSPLMGFAQGARRLPSSPDSAMSAEIGGMRRRATFSSFSRAFSMADKPVKKGVCMADKDREQLKAIGVTTDDDATFLGSCFSPTRVVHNDNHILSDWLEAATLVHKLKYYSATTDNKGNNVSWWKDRRREHCARFSFLVAVGMVCGMLSDSNVFEHNHHTIRSMSLQFISIVTSGLALHEMVWYYHSEMCVLRLKGWQLDPYFSRRSLKGANLWNQFVRDVIVILIQPIPFVTTGFTISIYDTGLGRFSVYRLDVYLLSLMFLRVIFIPRFYGHIVRDLHTDDADVFFTLNNTHLDDTFLLKFTMSTSLAALCSIFAVQVLLFAYMLLMFERTTLEGPLKTWASAIWLVITTMTTVGYGDVYPTTRMGRIVVVAACFSAMAMMAITIAMIKNMLQFTRIQSKVVWVLDSSTLIRKKRFYAGKVVLASLRVWRERIRYAAELDEFERDHSIRAVENGDIVKVVPPTQEASMRNVFGNIKKWIPAQASGLPALDEEKHHAGGSFDNQIEPQPGASLAGSFDNARAGSFVPGGGRGRCKKAQVVRMYVSAPLASAEAQWHVALQEFREAVVACEHDHIDTRSDIHLLLVEILRRADQSDERLKEIEKSMDAAIYVLRRLLDQDTPWNRQSNEDVLEKFLQE